MKILGYIVTEKKLTGVYGFVKQVDDVSDADLTKPTLIIGWELAKQFDGYDILDRRLGDKLFWTFKRTENRSTLESDLLKFYDFVKENAIKNCEYKFISIFKLGFEKAKKLVGILNSKTKRNIYISNDIVYTSFGNAIIGVSLVELEYCKINPDKVLNKIKNNPSITLISSDDWKIQKLERFLGNNKYAVPYFTDE